jgi:hypothetical protein
VAARTTSSTDALALLRGNGQPWLFVLQAVEIAASPDLLRDLIQHTAFGAELPNPLPPPPPLPVWLSMYRSHRRMQNALTIADGIPEELNASDMLDELREFSRMSHEEVAADIAQSSEQELREFLSLFVGVPFPPEEAALRQMLKDHETESQSADPEEENLIDTALASPEGQYFLRIWWPCWFLYHEYPPRLLRAARQDDIDALDRLLRLDKFIVGDPGIAKRMGEYFSTGTPGQRKQLTAALNGKPKIRLTDKAIRSGLGALISQLAFQFKTSVTAPQIEELFNRIERIRSGRLADPAVSTGENWAKALQRNRDWPSLPTTKPDNKSSD